MSRSSFFSIEKLPEIPSELIEPYLKNFLSLQIEGIGCGLTKPQDARNDLKGVQYFVSAYCGIHARFATSNEYDRFCNLSDEDMVAICKKVFKEADAV